MVLCPICTPPNYRPWCVLRNLNRQETLSNSNSNFSTHIFNDLDNLLFNNEGTKYQRNGNQRNGNQGIWQSTYLAINVYDKKYQRNSYHAG